MSFLLPLIAGVIIGGLAGYFIARYRSRDTEVSAQLEKLQIEYDEYRVNVRSHFIDTVSLLSQIDENQKKLYQSVANGVVNLCSSEKDENDYFLEESARALGQLEDSGKPRRYENIE